jgi:hypothetical protein
MEMRGNNNRVEDLKSRLPLKKRRSKKRQSGFQFQCKGMVRPTSSSTRRTTAPLIYTDIYSTEKYLDSTLFRKKKKFKED